MSYRADKLVIETHAETQKVMDSQKSNAGLGEMSDSEK